MQKDIIKNLENKRLIVIGRASGMCWIQFGNEVMKTNSLGKQRKVGEYAIHLQTTWRLVSLEDNSIILSSTDMFEERTDRKKTTDFDWEIQGNNLFDEKSERLFQEYKNLYVKSVKITKLGDIEVNLSDKFLLQTFISNNFETEKWRFFRPGEKDFPHLVSSGKNIELVY